MKCEILLMTLVKVRPKCVNVHLLNFFLFQIVTSCGRNYLQLQDKKKCFKNPDFSTKIIFSGGYYFCVYITLRVFG